MKCKSDKHKTIAKKAEWLGVYLAKHDEQLTNDLAKKLKKKGFVRILNTATGIDNNQQDILPFDALPDYSRDSVADNSVRLLFKLFDKLGSRFELRDKNVLVIGSDGAIGSEVCRRGRGFGCNVLDFDVANYNHTPELLERWLGLANVIILCVPLTDLTRNFFKRLHYKQMKNKPLIINASGRISLVYLEGLGQAIIDGLVGGYACDALPVDPRTWVENLFSKVYFEKHSGAHTIEAEKRKLKLIEDKLDSFSE